MTATPTPRIQLVADRLRQISDAIANGNRDELTMRVPAEPDRDADLVLSEASVMLTTLERENAALRACLSRLVTAYSTSHSPEVRAACWADARSLLDGKGEA